MPGVPRPQSVEGIRPIEAVSSSLEGPCYSPRQSHLCSCATLVLTTAAVAAPAAAQPSLEPLLAGEATPGTGALLVRHVSRPEAHRRLSEALRHPRADVRAAAARVIYVVGARGLVPDLAVAFGSERAADPALEMGRALAALGGPTRDAAVFASWTRVAPGTAGRLAVAFAGVRGPAAADALPRLRAADANTASLTAYLVAARPDATALDGILATAVAEGDQTAFGAALDAARELKIDGTAVPVELMVAVQYTLRYPARPTATPRL